MEKKNQDKKLNIWGIGCAGEGFISSISGTYLPIFLTDVAMVSVGLSGAITIMTSIVGFVMATITGGLIAALKPMKWGRLRSYTLIGPPIATVFWIVHFTSVPGNPILTAFLVILGYLVGVTAWNFAYAANMGMMNILGKDQVERNRFNSQRMIGSNLGRLMGNYLTPIIVAFLATRVTERASYPILVCIAGVFFIFSEHLQFKITEGKEDNYYNAAEDTAEGNLKMRDVIEILKSNRQLLVALLIDLTSNMSGIALPSLAVYYYKYVFEAPQFVSTHMLCIGLCGLCGSTIVRFIGTKVKDYKKFLMSVYLIMSCALFATKFTTTPIAFLLLNVCVHLMTGTTQPFETNLYQDNVIYTEWKTGVNANSLIMGLVEFPVKIAGILKNVLLTSVLLSSGYVAGEAPTMALKNALQNAYAFIPGCIPIMGFLLLKFAYKLTPEKIDQCRRDIETRRNYDHV